MNESNTKNEDNAPLAPITADEAADAKGNFLALISHEIRTPLQSVFSLLELIGDENPNERVMSMVHTAKESAANMLEMLDGILDFAKIDADKMILDRFEVPVRTLVQSVVEAMEVRTKNKNVTLGYEVDDAVPYVIYGDPQRLRQILINLTGNALKFTDEGMVTIKVNMDATHIKPADENLAIRFEICDSGIGIDETAQTLLFQPFNQAELSTSRQYGGTGLGLSICKKLTDLMSGEIGVISTKGEGSTFWFEIPTQSVSLDDIQEEMPSLDGLSILSVEDHPQGAYEIKRSLESMGAKVLSCRTYAEGIEAATTTPFDVAIIDQGLPDGLGLHLIREISETKPYLGMIMYTARDDEGMKLTLRSLGIPYISKPASRLGLALAIQDAADKTIPSTQKRIQRILVAEDTPSVRDVLSRQFVKLGVEADFVEHGKEALRALEEKEYGLLISDLHMPVMNGYELTKTIRDQEAVASDKDNSDTQDNTGTQPDHLPIILLTADIQIADRQTYQKHGFDECLVKPVSVGQIKHLLIRWGILNKSDEYSSNSKTDSTAEIDNIAATSSCVTNIIPEDVPVIDTNALKKQMGAFDQDSIDMLDIFVEMTPFTIEKLLLEGENKDYYAIAETAHSLKGSTRSACCTQLGELASQIQDLARVEDEKCLELVILTLAAFNQIKEELERIRKDVQ